MRTCNDNIEFRQGEDIEFNLSANAEFEDLDANDWQLLFYSTANSDIVVLKEDMTLIEPNKYYGSISKNVTKNLATDTFTCELLYGNEKKKIAINDMAFKLLKSNSKKYIT